MMIRKRKSSSLGKRIESEKVTLLRTAGLQVSRQHAQGLTPRLTTLIVSTLERALKMGGTEVGRIDIEFA
jgi:hypothetical protein